jgi:UDP-GlcNAc:undecaprenyl-phosphate GlcNAc-1-phosphate transferase
MGPLIAFSFTLLAGLALIRYAHQLGFIDIPNDRKIHNCPIPRTGGIAILLGIGLTLLLIRSFPAVRWQTLTAGAGVFTLGFLDDRQDLNPKFKLLVLCLFALMAAWPWVSGAPGTAERVQVFGQEREIPRWVATALLFGWFISVPNVMNIEDAINGYVSGFLALFVAATTVLHGQLAYTLLAALLGFLVLNWPKAQHFLGDAGSLSCGFILAECVLRAGGDKHPAMALICTAPMSLDVAVGFLRRLRLGQSLFHADRCTFPHRVLSRCGGSPTLACLILWANAGVCIVLASIPALAIPYLGGLLGVLIWMNRAPLFHRQNTLPDPSGI